MTRSLGSDPTGLEQRPAAAVIVDGIVVDDMTRLGGNALSICPKKCLAVTRRQPDCINSAPDACGLSGYVPFGLQPYAIQTTAFGTPYTTFGGITRPSELRKTRPVISAAAKRLASRQERRANGWVSVPGTVTRPMKWKPRSPVLQARGGCQPGVSWDPDGGHWDVTGGNKTKNIFLPDGTKRTRLEK